MLIIRDALFAGATRFTDFQRSLGVAPNVLVSRLEGFVAAGPMIRQPTTSQHDHYDYLLTEKGRDLQPVIIALVAWGYQWAAPNGPPVLLEHVGCGGRIDQPTRCASCDRVLDPTSVRARVPEPTSVAAS